MARTPTVSSDSVAHDQIRAFVERIERLDEELKSINDDKKEVFAEAKGNGFDTKALKIVIRKRAQDYGERMELEAIVELYEAALGMRAAPRDDDEDEGDDETGTRVATRAPAHEESQPATDPKQSVAAVTVPPDGEGGEGGTAGTSAALLATHMPETANERLDDLGSVQDGRKMSMDGQQGGGAATAGEEPTPVVPAAALTNSNTREGAPATEGDDAPPTSSVVQFTAKKQWKHSDPAHRDCLNPSGCGGFSNLGLCPQCREAAAGGQVA